MVADESGCASTTTAAALPWAPPHTSRLSHASCPPARLVEAGEAALRVAAHHQHCVRAHRLHQRRLAVGWKVSLELQAACQGAGATRGRAQGGHEVSGRQYPRRRGSGRAEQQRQQQARAALPAAAAEQPAACLPPRRTREQHQVSQVVACAALHGALADGAGRRGAGRAARWRHALLHQAAPAVEERQAARARGAPQRVPHPARAQRGAQRGRVERRSGAVGAGRLCRARRRNHLPSLQPPAHHCISPSSALERPGARYDTGVPSSSTHSGSLGLSVSHCRACAKGVAGTRAARQVNADSLPPCRCCPPGCLHLAAAAAHASAPAGPSAPAQQTRQ